jgi:hypothetical protein
LAFKYKLPYLKNIDLIGFKYRKYKDTTKKYNHISDPRYCKYNKNLNYMKELQKYQD